MFCTDTSLHVEASARLKRTDLEYLAVVAGIGRDAQLAAAIFPGHDRHHRDDPAVPRLVERGPDRAMLAKLDQIARGRKRQLEPAAFAAHQRLARRDPDGIRGLLAVVGAGLVRRGGGEEE